MLWILNPRKFEGHFLLFSPVADKHRGFRVRKQKLNYYYYLVMLKNQDDDDDVICFKG